MIENLNNINENNFKTSPELNFFHLNLEILYLVFI